MPTTNSVTPSYPSTPTTLANYTTAVQRLVHDSTGSIYATQDYTDTINEARNRVVGDTACLRLLQTVVLNTGQEAYNLGSIPALILTAGGSGYSSAPTVTFSGGGSIATQATATATVSGGAVTGFTLTSGGANYDMANFPITMAVTHASGSGAKAVFGAPPTSQLAILGVNLIFSTTRYTLDWRPWSQFSAKMRYWLNFTQQPTTWAEYGGTLYIAPIPDQPYQVEVDSLFLPAPLVNSGDTDIIPVRFQSPIKYYAAYLLKLNEQSMGEADFFRNKYEETLRNCLGSSVQRRIPSQYSTNVTGY